MVFMLLSSAKRTGMEILLKILGKLLIYIKKNKGPRIDPKGTPCEILPHIEAVVLLGETFETILTL
jgi:hypothetical protein